MKALIIMTVLAMATSAIAVPLSRQAKAQALLAAMQDNAEMEGLLSYIGNAIAKHGPGLLKKGIKAAGDAGIWNEELDRESAVVQEEAEMDNAEMEGLLSYIGNAIAKHGPGLLKKGIKAAGDAGIWNEELDRESAVVQEEAEMERLLRDIKKLRLLDHEDVRVQGPRSKSAPSRIGIEPDHGNQNQVPVLRRMNNGGLLEPFRQVPVLRRMNNGGLLEPFRQVPVLRRMNNGGVLEPYNPDNSDSVATLRRKYPGNLDSVTMR